MGRKAPPKEPIRVIKEQKRLVLSRLTDTTWSMLWGFNTNTIREYKHLQEWIDYFEKDKDYVWTIEYVTSEFIIMVREEE